MTFWHTERLTKHRSSPGGSNRAIIDDLTVRDLEPYLGHPEVRSLREDTRPKGGPIIYPSVVKNLLLERTPEGRGKKSAKNKRRDTRRRRQVEDRRSWLFPKKSLKPWRSRNQPENREKGTTTQFFYLLLNTTSRKIRRSSLEGVEEAQSRNRRKIQTWRRDPEERRQMPARCSATARDTVREICKMEPARRVRVDRALPPSRKLLMRKLDLRYPSGVTDVCRRSRMVDCCSAKLAFNPRRFTANR